jgi:hypothetical protein
VRQIEDFDLELVEELLHFLYTDMCNVCTHIGCGCIRCRPFVLANRYNVPELKRSCEHQLLIGMNADNVLAVLSLAELYDSTALKQGVLGYVARHPTVLLQSGTFIRSLSAQQCHEVLCAAAGVKSATALGPARVKDKAAASAGSEWLGVRLIEMVCIGQSMLMCV